MPNHNDWLLTLSNFKSIQFRYPDDYLFSPKKEVVEEALLVAKKIYNFVTKIIKELESGQKNIFY